MPKFSNEPQPILAAWSRTLSRHGEAPAVLAADGGVLRTFKGIEHEARELEICLGALQRGSVAAVQLGNDPRLPAVLIALWRRGIIPLLLDRAVEKDALSAALNISRADAHITRCNDGKLDLLHFASQTETPPFADFLKLTSGTTGTPRAIRFTAAQLLADCEDYHTGFSPNVQDILENFKLRNQLPTLSKADALADMQPAQTAASFRG